MLQYSKLLNPLLWENCEKNRRNIVDITNDRVLTCHLASCHQVAIAATIGSVVTSAHDSPTRSTPFYSTLPSSPRPAYSLPSTTKWKRKLSFNRTKIFLFVFFTFKIELKGGGRISRESEIINVLLKLREVLEVAHRNGRVCG